jgi:hypothetical protein
MTGLYLLLGALALAALWAIGSYNALMRARIQVFPTVLIAGALSFGTREFFEVEVAAERAVPQVAF